MTESGVDSGSGCAADYYAAVPGSVANSASESVMLLNTGASNGIIPSGDES